MSRHDRVDRVGPSPFVDMLTLSSRTRDSNKNTKISSEAQQD
jgi:hypothetical protein